MLFSGHDYLNLVEKSEDEQGQITAEAEAIIWANQYLRIKAGMEIPIEAILQEGMEVMLKVKPDFHERYGFKLIIEGIDTAYTVGRLALERQKIVRQLRASHLLEKNGSLELPVVLQHIAVLSTDTAAGYQDFMDHMVGNRFNYCFNITLFKMAMQGENTVGEALRNLKKIRRSSRPFDCVVFIRGGGAKLSLKAFDDYELSEAVANFPIPVITGIGHERDESVLDLVAHTSLKTPTAVADFCIEHNFSFETELAYLGRQINHLVLSRIKEENLRLNGFFNSIKHLSQSHVKHRLLELFQLKSIMPNQMIRRISAAKKELEHLELIVNLLDMEQTLSRGYSIATTETGLVIRKTGDVKEGDILITRVKKGTLTSKITKRKS